MLNNRLKKLELEKQAQDLRPKFFFYYLDDDIEKMEIENTKGLHPDVPVINYHIPYTRQGAIEAGLDAPTEV